jgi:hypothetical protein
MKVHFEPYLYIAGLTHKSALIAWGGFYFKIARIEREWRLIDDSDLDTVHPPRKSSIGASSFPRYLAAVGEATEVPPRSPGRGPPYWKSRVLRRQAFGEEDDGQGRWVQETA